MKADTFVMSLTRGAVASAIAGGVGVPQSHSADTMPPTVDGGAEWAERISAPREDSRYAEKETVEFRYAETPDEWTEAMNREFRRLALREAEGTITTEQAARLEKLSALRDRLYHARSADEILLQLKRDRVVERIAEALKEYVEFQKTASGQGATTS